MPSPDKKKERVLQYTLDIPGPPNLRFGMTGTPQKYVQKKPPFTSGGSMTGCLWGVVETRNEEKTTDRFIRFSSVQLGFSWRKLALVLFGGVSGLHNRKTTVM